MANRNGMGPLEQGPNTGRGFGPCNREYQQGYGRGYGRGYGLGYGRNCRRQFPDSLLDQKAVLEQKLDEINNQLKNN